MHWLALMAYAAFARKLIQRHRKGNEVGALLADPDHVRTLAQFELADPEHTRVLLVAIASALRLDGWVVEDMAIRAHRPGTDRDVEAVRLVACGEGHYTLEVTRMWTGAELGAPTRALLIAIHDVLAADPHVLRLGWHQRQDRALAVPFAAPVAV
jgi:hypothetical protein